MQATSEGRRWTRCAGRHWLATKQSPPERLQKSGCVTVKVIGMNPTRIFIAQGLQNSCVARVELGLQSRHNVLCWLIRDG
jgi:hypothetical protein